jgi:hypothetical protein
MPRLGIAFDVFRPLKYQLARESTADSPLPCPASVSLPGTIAEILA